MCGTTKRTTNYEDDVDKAYFINKTKKRGATRALLLTILKHVDYKKRDPFLSSYSCCNLDTN